MLLNAFLLIVSCRSYLARGSPEQQDRSIPMKRSAVAETFWGLTDVQAYVGRYFRYDLFERWPRHDRTNKVRVVEYGKEQLPPWLHASRDSGMIFLEGVTTPSDVGRFYIQVIFQHDKPLKSIETQDVFTIDVIDETPPPDIYPIDKQFLRPVACPRNSAITSASVLIDAGLSEMSALERTSLLRRFCGYFEIPIHFVQMIPAAVEQSLATFTIDSLVAGPGDTPPGAHGRQGVVFTWNVGCSNVLGMFKPALELLERSASTGELKQAIGHGVNGWFVSNKRKSRPSRRVRFVVPNPTPVPNLVFPTYLSPGIIDTPAKAEVPRKPWKTDTSVRSTTMSGKQIGKNGRDRNNRGEGKTKSKTGVPWEEPRTSWNTETEETTRSTTVPGKKNGKNWEDREGGKTKSNYHDLDGVEEPRKSWKAHTEATTRLTTLERKDTKGSNKGREKNKSKHNHDANKTFDQTGKHSMVSNAQTRLSPTPGTNARTKLPVSTVVPNNPGIVSSHSTNPDDVIAWLEPSVTWEKPEVTSHATLALPRTQPTPDKHDVRTASTVGSVNSDPTFKFVEITTPLQHPPSYGVTILTFETQELEPAYEGGSTPPKTPRNDHVGTTISTATVATETENRMTENGSRIFPGKNSATLQKSGERHSSAAVTVATTDMGELNSVALDKIIAMPSMTTTTTTTTMTTTTTTTTTTVRGETMVKSNEYPVISANDQTIMPTIFDHGSIPQEPATQSHGIGEQDDHQSTTKTADELKLENDGAVDHGKHSSNREPHVGVEPTTDELGEHGEHPRAGFEPTTTAVISQVSDDDSSSTGSTVPVEVVPFADNISDNSVTEHGLEKPLELTLEMTAYSHLGSDARGFPVSSHTDAMVFPETIRQGADALEFPATIQQGVDALEFPATSQPGVDALEFPATIQPGVDALEFPATGHTGADRLELPSTTGHQEVATLQTIFNTIEPSVIVSTGDEEQPHVISLSTGVASLPTGVAPLSTSVASLSTGVAPLFTGMAPLSTGAVTLKPEYLSTTPMVETEQKKLTQTTSSTTFPATPLFFHRLKITSEPQSRRGKNGKKKKHKTPTPAPQAQAHNEGDRQTHAPTLNSPPVAQNRIDPMHIFVGNILHFRVPNVTFRDTEDGWTDRLQLLLFNYNSWRKHRDKSRAKLESFKVPPDSWIQLNRTSQTLYGMPMEEHIGRHKYILTAIDSRDQMEHTDFEIYVQRRPTVIPINYEFFVVLNGVEYNRVIQDASIRIDIAGKIAHAFGDQNTDKMTVTQITYGSVRYAWTNNSLPIDSCPDRALRALIKKMSQQKSNERQVTDAFSRSMRPYIIMSAGFTPLGICLPYFQKTTTTTKFAEAGWPSPSTASSFGRIQPVSSHPESASHRDESTNILLYIMIPLVVLASVLFVMLMACICCYVCRRNQRPETQKESKTTPVIFADELGGGGDDRVSGGGGAERWRQVKPILADEASPLTPPSYAHSLGSRESTLRSNYKTSLGFGYDDSDDQGSFYSTAYNSPGRRRNFNTRGASQTPVVGGGVGSLNRNGGPPPYSFMRT